MVAGPTSGQSSRLGVDRGKCATSFTRQTPSAASWTSHIVTDLQVAKSLYCCSSCCPNCMFIKMHTILGHKKFPCLSVVSHKRAIPQLSPSSLSDSAYVHPHPLKQSAALHSRHTILQHRNLNCSLVLSTKFVISAALSLSWAMAIYSLVIFPGVSSSVESRISILKCQCSAKPGLTSIFSEPPPHALQTHVPKGCSHWLLA